MADEFSYVFPAIRGVQAGREYYVSMCPLRLLSKLFIFNEEELVPELRAQRSLNRSRVPEMARYIVENKNSYVFSAITASIDGKVKFEAVSDNLPAAFRMGSLRVPMEAKFIVNDGQHRRAAIEAALNSAPTMGDETIAVVFFVDRGLKRCQQMFSDLNRYAVKPSPSLSILYDHRSVAAQLAKQIGMTAEVFRDVIEGERSNLSPRSRKLFTLSALHHATIEMIPEKEIADINIAANWCKEYWEEVGSHIPEWKFVRESKMTAGDVRRDFIHSHAIVLQALGRAGKSFVYKPKHQWAKQLIALRKIDWSRSNAKIWEGRAMLGGQVCKASQNITLTSNYIKQIIGLALDNEEQVMEDAFMKSRHPTRRRSAK